MNEQYFEKLLHIDTSGFQQGYPKKIDYHRYEPTPYVALEQLFEQYELPQNPVCIDVGCGKGRVPIYLHHKFHAETVGIEMDPKFFAAAEYNKMQYLHKYPLKKSNISFLHMVAESYDVQIRDNVFFFFNPFSIHIFRQVMNKIMESYMKHPRTIHFIFYYPSPEYMNYLSTHPLLEYLQEVHLKNEKNINERVVIFTT